MNLPSLLILDSLRIQLLLFSPRETSLAARSKEKRLYSQATFLRAASHESVGANSPAPQIKQHVRFSYDFEYETSYSSI